MAESEASQVSTANPSPRSGNILERTEAEGRRECCAASTAAGITDTVKFCCAARRRSPMASISSL